MQNVAVIGGQWGDEGKGKIVDLITDRFDIVARFQGGPNAGHSVKFEDKKFSLHHIPSGIFRERVKAVLGNGMVLDLERLLGEMDDLHAAGIILKGRLYISDRAHLILPVHRVIDELRETSMGESKIGTTKLGIGPTYQSKMGRCGVRVMDLKNKELLKQKIDFLHNELLRNKRSSDEKSAGMPDETYEMFLAMGSKLEGYIHDTSHFLNEEMKNGARVLFEGAQGVLLDIDHGTFPYVTSSNSSAAGICAGLGISPKWVHGIIGVFKAYETRVGAGPFPTEESGEVGDAIRKLGNEFGTTTGRPRRCGWFDTVAARYSVTLNNFDCIAVTLLDVLSGIEEIKICTKYRYKGNDLRHFPSEPWILDAVEPVYEKVGSWGKPINDIRTMQDLPKEAQEYLGMIARLIGCKIGIVSVGPWRNQSIMAGDNELIQNL